MEPPTSDDGRLPEWCRAFLAFVPQAAADGDTHLASVRSACVKIMGSPAGDDPRLTLDEASSLVAAFRTWPDGKAGTSPDLYRSEALRRWCTAWLDGPTDEPDAPPEFLATRVACQKTVATVPGKTLALSWAEARALNQTLRTLDDMDIASGISVPLRERTALGRLWDRLRGDG